MINLEFVKLYVSALHSCMKLEIKNLVLSSLIICYKNLFFFIFTSYSIWKPFLFVAFFSCKPVHVEISSTYSASDLGSDCDYACFLTPFQNSFSLVYKIPPIFLADNIICFYLEKTFYLFIRWYSFNYIFFFFFLPFSCSINAGKNFVRLY